MPTHVRPDQHTNARFPALDKIPEQARGAVQEYLKIRARLAAARQAHATGHLDLKTGIQADRAALEQHIADGGSTSTFTYTRTEAAKKAIIDADADAELLDVIAGKAYLKTVGALKTPSCMTEGKETADTAVQAAHREYTAAISELRAKRQAYLDAVALSCFWHQLAEQNLCIASSGMDQIIIGPKPLTRVDNALLSALQSDAQAHTRIDGTSEAADTW